MNRVVVTGMGANSALGTEFCQARVRLANDVSCVQRMSEWEDIRDLNAKLAAPITDFEAPAHFSRKIKRTMGRVSLLAVTAAERAVSQAGLADDALLSDGRTGVAFGSSTGSPDALQEFNSLMQDRTLDGINSTTYIRMMSHTAAVNLAMYFKAKGRVVTTSSACTSGSQGIGYAYEAIKYGKQTAMLAGGGEELCPSEVAVFDTLFATSTSNDTPHDTPRPFDRDRDGLVIGEGAGVLVLEELHQAEARGAQILAEVVGYGTNCDGAHVTQPQQETMGACMRLALADAGLEPSQIGYINAHGTATERGDIAESCAVAEVFGNRTPMSSLKGHIGHTLGACGALEAWLTVEMARAGDFAPTLNLANPDERCGDVDYVMGGMRKLETEFVMSNNFAFGGINTSLIFRIPR